MTNQKDVFLHGEGDAYFKRNHGNSFNDIIVPIVKLVGISPGKVLEIGCGEGLQLQQFKKIFGSQCYGIDPSKKAVSYGNATYPEIQFGCGTADNLPFGNKTFDLILFGFCLYLCDRDDLFKIAYEADRCLVDGGHIVILDFLPPFPYYNNYKHYPGAFSYKQDYSKMFTWNPQYIEIAQVMYPHEGKDITDLDNRIGVIIIKKIESLRHGHEREPE